MPRAWCPSPDPPWPLGQLHVLFKLVALKCSMRLNNRTFKIGTLRQRQRQRQRQRRWELGRISYFKWLEAALNLGEIKNPFGSVHTNPEADAWWVPLFFYYEKVYFWNQGCTNCGSLATGLRGNGERMRKWRGNGERMRKWREIHSQDFLILCLFPPSLSISYMKNCHILSQNVKYGTFVANVTK